MSSDHLPTPHSSTHIAPAGWHNVEVPNVSWPIRLVKTVQAFRAHAGGSAAVEFAVVSPLYFLILFGIFAYGLYFGAAHGVAQLAADAARASVAGLSDAERSSIAIAQVRVDASSYPLLAAGQLNVEAGPLATDPSEFRVTVKYDASTLPLWNVATLLPLPSRTIVGTSVIKRGGF